jgi:hypothetical protein
VRERFGTDPSDRAQGEQQGRLKTITGPPGSSQRGAFALRIWQQVLPKLGEKFPQSDPAQSAQVGPEAIDL